MNVFNPNDTIHTLKVIPRFYPDGDVTIKLHFKERGEPFTQTLTPIIADGYMTIFIDKVFSNNQNMSITISQADEIVYRGKIFVTDQATQEYSLTDDIFKV